MKIMKTNILPLFAKPVVCLNCEDINLDKTIALGQELDFVQTDKYQGSFDVSIDTNVLDRPEFTELKKITESSIEFFVRDICAIQSNIKFYITSSWYNKFKHMNSLRKHHHNNSIISGVIYLKTNDNSGPIVFHNDNYGNQLFPPNVDMEYASRNIFNATQHRYLPKPKDIILFPSYMEHSVDANSEGERHSIAFNVFVRGSFGLIHELNLK